MIRTGISGIDEMLGPGIPEGTRVLFSLEPGVDGRLFMLSTLRSALLDGRRCLVVVPTSNESVFRCDLGAVGGAVAAAGQLTVIDSNARETINHEARSARKRKSCWISLLNDRVKEERIDVLFVCFDLLYEDLGLEGGLEAISVPGTGAPLTTVVEHLNLEGEALISRLASGNIFDLIFSLQSAYTTVPFFNFFTLEHVAWARMPRRSIPYTSTDSHVKLYIPKIIVTGPPYSGKSTFVANASDRGISVDRGDLNGFRTTVAMDLGWLHLKGFDISLCGTPGQPRFDPIIPQLVRSAMGIVLVIDATRPEDLGRARDLMEIAFASKLPLVVAVNKADLPHRLDEQAVRVSLKLREDVPVVFISALRRSDAHMVVEILVERMTVQHF